MSDEQLSQIRTDYGKHVLLEDAAGSNPLDLFQSWFQDALKMEKDANAMTLSTGLEQPTSRVVLLKEVNEKGFVFFTNYSSQKGLEIEMNPNVGLLFFWQNLERQIRIQGQAERVSESESDDYFYSRPKESQIGALASNQSRVLNSRNELEETVQALTEKYKSEKIVRPKSWGGYVVKPDLLEFWQGRSSRLHDRLQYKLTNGEWLRNRLFP